MPAAWEILRSAKFITDNYFIAAIAWHVWIYFFILLLFISKNKPSAKTVALLMIMPLVSVAVIAGLTGVYFNAASFGIISLLLVIFSPKSGEPIHFTASPLIKFTGIVFIITGMLYPHFSDNKNLLFITGPTGLIPCPTLLLVIGFTLLFERLSVKWHGTLIVAALFYGVVGVFRLKVFLDILLLIAMLPLAWKFMNLWQWKTPGQTKKNLLYD
jgi:hypothetical protein